MAGPIREAIRKRLNQDEDRAAQIARDSPLLNDHQEVISEEMGDGGGCCGAMEVAQAIRSRGKEYR